MGVYLWEVQMDQVAKIGLRAGDLFEYPGSVVSEDLGVNTYYVAVLRVEKDGGAYLSLPWTGKRPTLRPDTPNNPYRVTTMGELASRHGVPSVWFSRAEHRPLAAQAVVREYEKVPRVDSVRRDVTLHAGVEAVDTLMHGSLYPILVGIVRNGEAGSPMERLSLALKVIGLGFTAEQLVLLSVYQELERGFGLPSSPE